MPNEALVYPGLLNRPNVLLIGQLVFLPFPAHGAPEQAKFFQITCFHQTSTCLLFLTSQDTQIEVD
jgi:hypothetical protein